MYNVLELIIWGKRSNTYKRAMVTRRRKTRVLVMTNAEWKQMIKAMFETLPDTEAAMAIQVFARHRHFEYRK